MVQYPLIMPLTPNDRIGSGQSTQELHLAEWWVQHRISLRDFLFVGLLTFITLTWGYGIWTLFDAYALSYPKEQRYTARILATTLAKDAFTVSAPQPLQSGAAMSLQPEANLQHLFAPVSNPNTLWWAQIQYRFRDGTASTTLRDAVLLPGDTRILTELGWQGTALLTPAISIESTVWKRIDPAIAGIDYKAYRSRLLNLQFSKAIYQSDLTINGKTLGQSSFQLNNPTGYAFRNVELLTLLYRNGGIAGINKLVLPHVAAGASSTISVVWPDNPIGITRVDVQPFVDILNPDTFKTIDQTGL